MSSIATGELLVSLALEEGARHNPVAINTTATKTDTGMYTEIQLCRSLLMDALSALEAGKDKAPALISAAKAKISETAELVTNEAVQLHGGIGVTDELEIGFFLKRARVAQLLLGDAHFHYDRYASLEGF